MARVYTGTSIRAGAPDIWVGVTLPGDGLTVDLTAGVPGSGSHMGGIEGATTLNSGAEYEEIQPEQFTAPTDAFLLRENFSVQTTMLEWDHAKFAYYMPQTTQSASEGTPSGAVSFVGGKLTVSFNMVVITAPFRNDTSKYLHIGIYRALMTAPIAIALGRETTSGIPVTWTGHAVSTYTAGKQLGYFKVEA